MYALGLSSSSLVRSSAIPNAHVYFAATNLHFDTYYSDIGNRLMVQEKRLELSGGDLIPLNLNQFLQSV